MDYIAHIIRYRPSTCATTTHPLGKVIVGKLVAIVDGWDVLPPVMDVDVMWVGIYMSCHHVTCHVMLCYVMLCYVMLCYVKYVTVYMPGL